MLATVPAAAQTAVLAERKAAAGAAPADFAAQRAYGQALIRAGHFDEAEKVLRRARGHAPSDSVGTLRLAEVWIAAGEYQRARGTCKALLREHKGADPLMRLCLAEAYLAWNRSSRAFAELDRVLAEAPQLLEAQLVLAEAHRLRFHPERAEAAYERARRDPELRAEAELGLGRLYAANDRRDEAVAALRRALELQPELPAAQYELGLLLSPAPEGAALLESAWKNRPDWPEAASATGDARFALGDLAGAEQAYRAAIAGSDYLHTGHRGLGRTLLARDQLGEAEQALRRSLELFAHDAEANRALGEVLVGQGRSDEALEVLRHAADLDPQDPRALLRAAELCLTERRYTLAAGYLDRLLQKHPRSAAGLALYGDVARVRGQIETARQFYERALEAEGPVDRGHVTKALGAL